ncbi:MAG: hypothetical protein H0Z28_08580 [Archaeoglobus sp.]|nr:hypothetical protein [Archaeoglobus sp.]
MEKPAGESKKIKKITLKSWQELIATLWDYKIHDDIITLHLDKGVLEISGIPAELINERMIGKKIAILRTEQGYLIRERTEQDLLSSFKNKYNPELLEAINLLHDMGMMLEHADIGNLILKNV